MKIGRFMVMILLSLSLLILLFNIQPLSVEASRFGDFEYELRDDGTSVEITEYVGMGGSVTIPSHIEGKPVTIIGRSAFSGKQLTIAVIPDSVREIGPFAFANNQLTSVSMGSGVKLIGDYSFYSNQLATVIIPASVTSIIDNAFAYNLLTEVTIPESVEGIGALAFAHNPLERVTIYNNQTTIAGHDPFLLEAGPYGGEGNIAGHITFYGHNPSTIKTLADAVSTYTFVDLAEAGEPADPPVTPPADPPTYDPRFTDRGEVAANKDWTIQFNREVDTLAGIFVSSLVADIDGTHRIAGVDVVKDDTDPKFVLVKAPAGGYPGGDYYLFVTTEVTSGGKALPRPVRMKFSVSEPAAYHPFAGGSGTASDPYQVGTARQLHEVRNYLDKHFIQVADIDLSHTVLSLKAWYDSTAGWEPIGVKEDWNRVAPFSGSYDGKGFTITGLFINRPDEQAVGLFGSVEDASIKNVSLEQVNVRGRIQVGGLVGSNRAGEISGSSVQGDVHGEWSWTGGLVGSNYGTIINSNAAGNVSSPGDFIGGLAGFNHQPGVITNSYSLATVNGKGVDNATAGGLVGVNHGEIKDSYATGNVSTKGTVGGLIGTIGTHGSLVHCYATGRVTGDRPQFTGGLVGYNLGQEHANVINSYWNTDTTNQSESAGGEGKSDASMKQQATFVDWDFVNVWQIDEGLGYPYLRYQESDPGTNPVSEYKQMTLTHFGFSFATGKTAFDGISEAEQDGYLGGNGVYVGYGENRFPAHLGNVELSGITDVRAIDFPETAQSLQTGHVYVAQCRIGYAKFKVLTMDMAQASAEVEYMYSSTGLF